MPRRFSWKNLSLIVFFLIVLFSQAPAQARVHIPLEGQAVMAGNSGAFSYSIPIQVPPGRNGLTPQLALTYNSRMENGFLGMGWSLPIGHVMRNTKHGLDFNCTPATSTTPCFIYMLGGSASELIPRADWCPDCFGAKIEGAFTRFEYVNGQYWKATDKGGTEYLFGQTGASQQYGQFGGGGVFKWELDRAIDNHSNSVDYTYFKEDGEIYIDKISYQGIEIQFYRDGSRTDKPFISPAEKRVRTAYRLRTIAVRWNSGIVRVYQAEYEQSPNTGRSRLVKILLFGNDAVLDSAGTITNEAIASQLPSVDLTATDGTNGITELVYTQSAPNWGEGAYTWVGDFNGDGIDDLASASGGTIWVKRSTGSSFVQETWTTSAPNWGGYGYTWTGDFNGDGKTDIASASGGTIWVKRSTGSSFVQETWTTSASDWGAGAYTWTGDFNGDGKTDIATASGGTIWVKRSTGSSFVQETWTTSASNWGAGAYTWPGDFNGDGKTDIATASGGTIWVKRSTGSSFVEENWTAFASAPNWGQAGQTMVGDFNGDGKMDIATGLGGTIWVKRSEGRTFVEENWTASSPAPSWGHEDHTWAADFNGDGKTDIATSFGGTTWVKRSTGDSFKEEIWTTTAPNWGQADHTRIGDFNGDGKTDIATASGGTIWVKQSTPFSVDLITRVKGRSGGETTVSYSPSSIYSNTRLPFPMQVVSLISSDDGMGNQSTTSYSYLGGYYNATDREFRGFSNVDATHNYAFDFVGYIICSFQTFPLPSNCPISLFTSQYTLTKTYYHQGNFTGPGPDDGGASPGYMQGIPYRIESRDKNGFLISEQVMTYSLKTSSPAYFAPLVQTRTTSNELSGGSRITQSNFDYDTYGNITTEYHYGDTAVGGDESTVSRSFASFDPQTDPWIFGYPKEEIIYEGLSVNGPKVAQATFYYDGISSGVAGCSEASTNQKPTKGKLTRLERWVAEGPAPESRMSYDAYGNPVCTRDAKGRVSIISYDITNTFPTGGINVLGQSTITEYYGVDSLPTVNGLYGQVKSVTDLNGQTTTTEYDAFGRPIKSTAPNGFWTTTQYLNFGDADSQHVKTLNAIGLSSWTYFDGLGRTTTQKSTGPDSKITRADTIYNNLGQVTRVTQPYFEGEAQNGISTFLYDTFGRQTQVTYPDGTRSLTCYTLGAVAGINVNNQMKRETRDALGRLVQVDEYTGSHTTCPTSYPVSYATTHYEYNMLGNLEKVTDTAGNVTRMVYDSLGRKTSMDDPDMGIWSYKYDILGNLEEQADAKNQKLFFQYDALNRIRQKDFDTLKPLDSGDVQYTYDIVPPWQTSFAIGRLSQVIDASGTTQFTYDHMGRVASTLKFIDGRTYVARTDYDIASRVKSVTYPDLDVVQYAYNGPVLSRVYNENSAETYAQYTGRNVFGQPARIAYGNGVTTDYTYSNPSNSECPQQNQRLCRILTQSLFTYQSLQYAYDKVGNVTAINDALSTSGSHTNQNASFVYDDLNRLMSASGPYGGMTYAYDAIGNMTCNSRFSSCGTLTNTTSTSPTGQVWVYESLLGFLFPATLDGTVVCNSDQSECGITTTTTTNNYNYPSSGTNSVRPHAVSSIPGTNYTYDANGNMSSQGANLDPLQHDYRMSYNTENRLTQVLTPSEETDFVYDGDGGRVKKVTNAGTFIYIGKLFECVHPCYNGQGVWNGTKHIFAGSTRIASKPITAADTEISYFHPDHLGSTALVTDASGNIVTEYTYRPYGDTHAVSGPEYNYLYTNQQKDHETGLYYYNARYYDPALGRFTQADTIVPGAADPQAFNRYAYVRNNPINLIDPSGKNHKKIGREFRRAGRRISKNRDTIGFAALYFNPLLGSAILSTSKNESIQIGGSLGLQAFGGNIGILAGGFQLSKSETGRYILSAEIMIATVVVAVKCLPCAKVAWSAFAGEVIGAGYGGYSAQQAGGDVSKGVFAGTVVGGVTGAVSGYIPPAGKAASFWKGVALGAAEGGVSGAGLGAVGGYAGGAGNWDSIGQGALKVGASGIVTGGILGGANALGKLSDGISKVGDYFPEAWTTWVPAAARNLPPALLGPVAPVTFGAASVYGNLWYENKTVRNNFFDLIGEQDTSTSFDDSCSQC